MRRTGSVVVVTAAALLAGAGCADVLGFDGFTKTAGGSDASMDGPAGQGDRDGESLASEAGADGAVGDGAGGDGPITPSGPDFVLTVGAPYVDVVRGATGSVPVNVAAQDGFAGAIAVTVAGLPTGVTVDPLTIPAGATSGTLTLHAANAAVLGDAAPPLTVAGAAGALQHTAALGLLVQDASGGFDSTFGAGGIANNNSFYVNQFGAMAIQGDGKIVVCGEYDELPVVTFVQRFNLDGSPDATFGAGIDAGTPGMVMVPSPTAGQPATCTGIVALSSGNIAFVGMDGSTPWVVELRADGTRESGFGTAGIAEATNEEGSSVASLVADSMGNLIAAGTWTAAPYMVGFTSAGQINPGFGRNGYVNPRPAGITGLSAVALTPNGEIAASIVSSTLFGVERFTASGALDGAFYDQGTASVVAGTEVGAASAVAVQADGSVVIAGSASPATDAATMQSIAVARFTSDGHADTTFGAGGAQVLPLGTGPSYASAVVIDGSDRIVLAGYIETIGVENTFGVARLATGGGLDPSFAGGQGFVVTTGGYGASSVALEPDGRIVAAGAGTVQLCRMGFACNATILAVARYWP